MESFMANEKPKVIGEELDDAKVARYLDMQPVADENADFHVLTKAYRGLPPEPFERFLQLFVQSGRNINARDRQGRSFLSTIEPNIAHPQYVEIARRFGADS
jgi:hypothetical protein